METCGPSDIRRAVHDMLDDYLSEEPERTLRQRVVATYNGYQDAQRIYYCVYPELHEETGEELPPRHCSPFVPVHEQLATLKDLTVRCSNGLLWQNFCQRVETRLQENPVQLMYWLLDLNEEALLVKVPTNQHRTKLHINGRRSETYVTTGDPHSQMVTLSLSDAKAMDRRGLMGDEIVEANRVSYDQSRVRGVNDSASRFCVAAGLDDGLIRQRHEENKCYYCGTGVRGNTGAILHTFANCPDKIRNEAGVYEKMRKNDVAD